MRDDIAIRVENLGKSYQIGQAKSGDLRQSFAYWWDGLRGRSNGQDKAQAEKEFWALKNINFEIKRGEAVGIIGSNGAGKSTLLKILSRITEPSTGRFEINGRVSSLLEVGTGFHPELSGRENIYLNGTILGMKRREVKAKFDEIVAFSGVEKFIDTPVKHYSSGMKVRLAFSVAAHLEPEILIIDEVLAVGDAEFQKKCLGKMNEVSRNEGRTVLFVSHNMGAVQKLCNRAIVLEKGKTSFNGTINEGIDRYLNLVHSPADHLLSERIDRCGNGFVKLTELKVLNQYREEIQLIASGMDVIFQINYEAIEDFTDAIFRLQILDNNGYILFTCNNFHSGSQFTNMPKKGTVFCQIDRIPLLDGVYTINIQCVVGLDIADEIESASRLVVEQGDFFGTGKIPSVKSGILVSHKWTVS